ncbi:hypothetical protein Poly51_32190 [Rubripirellula tenax]|uniref:Ice-binding protein C-terminal domain-containing protein n=1 Tax=Rubripirellula tenax TaxID=2528015 RepID=A0A5C6F1V6_9BACT|nr:PEP-CTERM sorting domain-containing protein [Rubripirellula tenax]TWU54500.1 hypothetical protein Poly51_32190 [Rubripirellula tenax]
MKRVLSVLALMMVATAVQAGVLVESSLIVDNFRLVDSSGMILQAGVDYQISATSPALSLTSNEVNGSGVAVSSLAGNALVAPGAMGTTTATLALADGFIGSANEVLASLTAQSSFTANRDLSGVKALFDVSAFVDVSRDSGMPLGTGRGTTELTFGVSGFGSNVEVVLTPVGNFNLTQVGVGRAENTPTPPRAFETQAFSLLTNRTYGFTVSQTVTANFSAVPEPSSICAFGALGVVGLVASRRRKAAKNA